MSSLVRTPRTVTPLTPTLSKALPPIAHETVTNRLSRSYTMPVGVSHAQNFYNPARNAVYARFTTNDWQNSNVANYSLSEKERAEAERLRAEAWRTVKITDQRTKVRQTDASKRLNERVEDIQFWRAELQKEAQLNHHESESLAEHLRVLENAYQHTAKPLQISEECLMNREKRIGIDQVHDNVERQLTKEVEVIKRCQDEMRRLIEKTRVQLKLNRAALHEIDKDVKHKSHAREIDDRMYHLRDHSSGISYHQGVETVDNTLSIPQSWAKFSQENILRSQKCRAASENLRGAIDSLLRSCANEMWSQFNSVNNSFNARIRETTDAKNKLQANLQKTMGEIFDVDRSIALLRKAIADKEAPMKVAQTRLEERTHRLDVEICNDPAMNVLQREVHEIRESIRALKDKLRAAESALSRLNKTKSLLENDISVKENSLQIDAKYCMGMRKTFPMDPKVGPIFSMPIA